MKIALFASAFHPSLGGVEEVVRQLAHQLQIDGHEPLIVTNRWPKDLPEQEDFEGLSVRRFVFRVPERTWKQMGGALLYGHQTLNDVCRALKDHGIDLIHVHCVSSNAYYALQASQRLKLPFVVTLHGERMMDSTGLFQRSHFARRLLCSSLTMAEAITAVSDYVLKDAEQFMGYQFENRGRVIFNGISLKEFEQNVPYPHPNPYIFAIGRHVPQKGFDVLLRAFAVVKKESVIPHDIILAGDGPERTALQSLANNLGIGSSVHFPGRCNRVKTASLFLGCAFFVLPSREEPLGIVNLEAMAAGKAVIASEVGGVPEIVENEQNGLLVPGGDVATLSSALRRLCLAPMDCLRMGKAGKETVRSYDWQDIGSKYVSLYKDMCHPVDTDL